MALNYQTYDYQNAYNRARFSDNGGCGYVLKPEFLRDPSIAYSSIGSCGLNKGQSINDVTSILRILTPPLGKVLTKTKLCNNTCTSSNVY